MEKQTITHQDMKKIITTCLYILLFVLATTARAQEQSEEYKQREREAVKVLDKAEALFKRRRPDLLAQRDQIARFGFWNTNRMLEESGAFVVAALRHRLFYEFISSTIGTGAVDSLMQLAEPDMRLSDTYQIYFTSRMADLVEACKSDRTQRARRQEFLVNCLRHAGRDTTGMGLPSRPWLHRQPLFNVVDDKDAIRLAQIHRYALSDSDLQRKDYGLIEQYHRSRSSSSRMSEWKQQLRAYVEEKRARMGDQHPCYALTLSLQAMVYSWQEQTSDSALMLARQVADIYRRSGCKLAHRLAVQQLAHICYRIKSRHHSFYNNDKRDSFMLQPIDNIDRYTTLTREELALTRPVLGRQSVEVRLAEAELAVLPQVRATILQRRHEDLNPALWQQAVATYRQGHYDEACLLFDSLRRQEDYLYLKVRREYVWQWMAACVQKMSAPSAKARESLNVDEDYTLAPVDRSLTVSLDSLWTFVDDPRHEQFLAEARRLFGDASPQYARMLQRVWRDLDSRKQYVDAIKPLAEARTLCRRLLTENDPVYGHLLVNLGRLYNKVNYYQEAIATLEEAAACIQATEGRASQYYLNVVVSLVTCCRKAKDYDRSARWALEMADVWDDDNLYYDSSTHGKWLALHLAGNALIDGADKSDTLRLLKAADVLGQALTWKRKYIEKDFAEYDQKHWNKSNSSDYVEQIEKLCVTAVGQATAYTMLGRYATADSLYAAIGDMLQQMVSNDFEQRMVSRQWTSPTCYRDVLRLQYRMLVKRAANQQLAGNYGQSLAFARQALSLSNKVRLGAGLYHGGSKTLIDKFDYYTHLAIVGSLKKLGHLDEAQTELLATKALLEETFGRDELYYKVVYQQAKLCADMGRQAEAAQHIAAYWDYLSGQKLRQLVLLNPRERERFWTSEKQFFEETFPQSVYRNRQSDSYGLLYDNTLLTKGLLLNAETEIGRLIAESGTPQQQQLYQQLQRDQLRLMGELQKDSKQQPAFDVDSLRASIRTQEYELLDNLQQSNNELLASSLRTSWTAVRSHLQPTDLAIEFVTIPLSADSLLYGALTLRHDSQQPAFTPLFTRQQLQQVSTSDYYTTPALYQLVWQPLEALLAGADHIYFSPTGVLHQIAIEYLPGMEQRDVCRLSSTRELVRPVARQGRMDPALFGGIKYEGAATPAAASPPAAPAAVDDAQPGLLRALRGSARRMPVLGGSLHEVQDISRQMDQHHIPVLLATGSDGTEASFKALSGTKKTIIHISTHGFYQPDETAADDRGDDLSVAALLQADSQTESREDQSLSRSGLLMAGAADHIFGRAAAVTGDDGILTAREIARLDLRGLDLVVLSACETGLGDVSGEGVFGLQRGFKKAGATTLLMSLWKVDDQATQVLMTEFYRQLLGGKSKRQAFLAARQHLRQADGGRYDRPECWAAFVILDAR